VDILAHLTPLPLTTTGGDAAGSVWVWAETNASASHFFGANAWYPLDYYSPMLAMHPGARIVAADDVMFWRAATLPG
jgi:hypothetical protein